MRKKLYSMPGRPFVTKWVLHLKRIKSILRFGRLFVLRKILFKKVAISGNKLPKIKGSLCSILVNEVYDNCKSLPRLADSNGPLIVKLEHKAECRRHVLSEPKLARPLLVESLLKVLKHHNCLHSGIQINMENLLSNALGFSNDELNNNGSSSNKSSSSSSNSSSSSCSNGSSSIFAELLWCRNDPINDTLETAEEPIKKTWIKSKHKFILAHNFEIVMDSHNG